MDSTLRLRTRPWIWPALLSLDAPVIAVLWLLLFSRSLNVRVPRAETAVLAMAVWLIYVADRVLDSFRESDRHPLALRHHFYREYRAAFVAPFCEILLLASWIAWARLDEHTLRAGAVLSAMVVTYLSVVHFPESRARHWFPKEMAVALLFCAGTCLPVFTRAREPTLPGLASFIGFVMAAWMNTAMIEYTEWITLREGGAEQPPALTVRVARFLGPLGIGIGVLTLGAFAAPEFRALRPVLLAETASALALAALGANLPRISSNILRISADAVLCTPAVILVFLQASHR